MSRDDELYRGWMAHHGIALPQHRVEQAVTAYADLGSRMEELRSIPLSFLTDVIEPATADQWIEQGGRS